jgi:hypothetical protein
MKPRAIIVACVVLLGVIAVLAFGVRDQAVASSTLVVYKSPTCGCCGDWIIHMEEAGFDVEVRDMADVSPVKDQNGVSPRLRSCHTGIVDGYVIEGHVPAEHVVKLLAERPDVKGLAVPGMPLGSPGMEQGNPSTWQDYDVLAFDTSGRIEVFAHVTQNP